jgi:hypothetical protein
LFFLALFVPCSSPLGAAAATVASVAVALDVAFFKVVFDLTFLWIAPLSLLAGVVAGMLASLAPIGKRPGQSEAAGPAPQTPQSLA